jgi:hypothetical protein
MVRHGQVVLGYRDRLAIRVDQDTIPEWLLQSERHLSRLGVPPARSTARENRYRRDDSNGRIFDEPHRWIFGIGRRNASEPVDHAESDAKRCVTTSFQPERIRGSARWRPRRGKVLLVGHVHGAMCVSHQQLPCPEQSRPSVRGESVGGQLGGVQLNGRSNPTDPRGSGGL